MKANCINCEKETEFKNKCRWIKTDSGYNVDRYNECVSCGVEKDLPSAISEAFFQERKKEKDKQRYKKNRSNDNDI